MPAAPATDADIPAYWQALGLPGLADIHVHFLPEPVLAKVWGFFDRAEERYGMAWPVRYKDDEPTRLVTLRALGVRAVPALTYAHKPGMAAWLNDWSREFAARVPDAVHCATLFPEPGVTDYVGVALAEGARLFKVHNEVGGFAPDDPLLDGAWSLLAERRVPVVMHCGSAPVPGTHTGAAGLARLLAKHPDLTVVVAHLGMPEYHEFADLVESYDRVHLDTTMAGTDFTNRFAPMPESYVARLADLRARVVLGSDFPNIPYAYAHQLEALARLGLGDDWMRDVLWHNGSRLLGLDVTAPPEGPSAGALSG